MATTTNFGWTTPDDTGLVKDGASAIRTLGSAIDTSMAELKGGTTGQVLSKTSNTDMDFTWTALAVSDNWTLLNSGGTALTGAATITVSGISNRSKIFILVSGASSASASSFIGVRINADTATNYNIYGVQQAFGAAYAAGSFDNWTAPNETHYRLARLSSNAASTLSGYAMITGTNTSGVKVITAAASAGPGGGDGHRAYVTGGFWNSSASVTSVSLFSETGNFDAGTLFVYATS